MFRSLVKVALAAFMVIQAVTIVSCTTKHGAVKPNTSPVTDVRSATLSTEFTVFYDSDPPGAALYENGKDLKVGETPFWAIYPLTEKELKKGVIVIDPCRVVWSSGVTTTNHPGLVFNLKNGYEQKYMFVRPDLPGREADYDYGLKRLMKRYTDGEEGGN